MLRLREKIVVRHDELPDRVRQETNGLLREVNARINKTRVVPLAAGLVASGAAVLANQPYFFAAAMVGVALHSAFKHNQLSQWFQGEQEKLVGKHAHVFAPKLGVGKNDVLEQFEVSLHNGSFHFTRKQRP